MKERLVQLLDLEQLTPSKFADIIGVQRSSVSHVISGRNKPSYDFLQKTLKAFPGLNAEWLMLGEGTMYEQMGRGISGNLFEPPLETGEDDFPEEIPDSDVSVPIPDDSKAHKSTSKSASFQSQTNVNTEVLEDYSDNNSHKDQVHKPDEPKKVVQVMVFYDDDTFRTYTPSQ